jgi:hypothetical protein
MKQHPIDLFALLIGLAFAVTGAGVVIAQATDSAVSGRAAAAAGLILLGVVALAVTLLRNRESPAPIDPAAADPAGVDPSGSHHWFSPWDRAD